MMQPARTSQRSTPRSSRLPVIWLLVFYLLLFPLLFKPTIHKVDPVGYYSWLRSIVFDRDLNVDNEFNHFKLEAHVGVYTETGHRYSQWSSGPALLWLPFYLPAHSFLLLYNALGGHYATDGYGVVYTGSAALASTVYALAGLLMLVDVGKQLAAPRIAVLAVAAGWLASPLVFYMYSHPLMSHAVDFAVNALFIWVWFRGRERWTWQSRLAIGAAVGLATLVRVQNVLLLIAPGIELLAYLWVKRAALPWRSLLGYGVAMAGGLAIFLLPLSLFWRVVYGHWIYNPYAITYAAEGTTINFAKPHLLQLLFSNNHGLFIWSPLLLAALVGLLWMPRRDSRLAALLLINSAVQFYFVSTLSTWAGGGPSFGTRYLIGLLPALFLGLVIAYAELARRLPMAFLFAVSAFFVGWNFLLIAQYVLETIPRAGAADLGEMIRGQFTVIPKNLGHIIEILQVRQVE